MNKRLIIIGIIFEATFVASFVLMIHFQLVRYLDSRIFWVLYVIMAFLALSGTILVYYGNKSPKSSDTTKKIFLKQDRSLLRTEGIKTPNLSK